VPSAPITSQNTNVTTTQQSNNQSTNTPNITNIPKTSPAVPSVPNPNASKIPLVPKIPAVPKRAPIPSKANPATQPAVKEPPKPRPTAPTLTMQEEIGENPMARLKKVGSVMIPSSSMPKKDDKKVPDQSSMVRIFHF
jgi:hypothetical protein